jgi:excisionase family DNA binding protein
MLAEKPGWVRESRVTWIRGARLVAMDELLSTKQLGWVLGRSAGTVRDMIRDGEIEAVRIPGGFRIAKAEVLRLARDRIEAEAGRKLSDRKLEELIDDVIATNEPRG